MTDTSNTLILYGVPFSQPVRAVMWLMLYKQCPFRMVLVNPGSSSEKGSRHPSYLARNPGGTIPCLEDPESGFTLGEAHAIMTYLSRRFGWTDVYPEELEARAKVDWYLHFHHRNVREASGGLVAPKIRKDLNIPTERQDASKATLTAALSALDTGWLADSKYLCGDGITLADFAAYVEIGQLQSRFTNVYDFSSYANVSRWLTDMSKVDGHDDVHVALSVLGDISQEAPSMDTIRDANKRALKAMQVRIESFA